MKKIWTLHFPDPDICILLYFLRHIECFPGTVSIASMKFLLSPYWQYIIIPQDSLRSSAIEEYSLEYLVEDRT